MRPILLLLCLMASLAAADDKTTVRVRVEDSNGQPIAKAKLSAFLWSGKWDPTDITARSDERGQAELVGIAPDNYATIVAEAAGMATTTQDLELGQGEVREIKFQLRRPVKGSVRIVDKDDEPLAGVVLSSVQFNAGDGGSFIHRHAMNDPFPFEPSVSDAKGVILLPPMPAGSKINIVAFHPEFQPGSIDNLELIEGQLGTIKLIKGVPLQFKFVLGAGLDQLPESLAVNTSIMATPAMRDAPGTNLYFTRPLQANWWNCTMAPGKYRWIDVTSRNDEFTITPNYSSDDPNYAPLLNLADSQPHDFKLLVRKNVKVRGKLVGDLEGIGADTNATGWTENLHPTQPVSHDEHRWLPTSFASIKTDGTFELLLPPGAAKINFRGLKSAIVEPIEIDFMIEAGKELVLPEIKLRKLSPITGQVVDKQKRPIGQAIVRIYAGTWGSDYVTCDAEGQFSLSPDPIVDLNTSKEDTLPVSILAFDPHSRRCAHVDITDRWRQVEGLAIACEEQPWGWLIESIKRQEQRYTETRTWRQKQVDYWQEQREAMAAKFHSGSVGQPVPDLDKGTWLHSAAKSLKEFRGKYVLLDFWFIGCGPCHAEIPNLKLAHQRLGPDRFSVVSVHLTSQTVDNVRAFAEKNDLSYPVVVDNEDGEIEDAYRQAGLQGFPAYFLIDPDGRIVQNDSLSNFPSLRMFKAEIVWTLLQK